MLIPGYTVEKGGIFLIHARIIAKHVETPQARFDRKKTVYARRP